jgi:hypothetical protein
MGSLWKNSKVAILLVATVCANKEKIIRKKLAFVGAVHVKCRGNPI